MNNLESKQHFSLRKLSVGLASVMIGLSFFSAENKIVKADTISDDNSANIETVNQKAPTKTKTHAGLGTQDNSNTQANSQVDKTRVNSDQTPVLAETKTSVPNSATANPNITLTDTTSNENILSTTNNSSNSTLESQSQKSSKVNVRSKRAVAPLNLVRELNTEYKMNVDVASNGSNTHIVNPNDPRKGNQVRGTTSTYVIHWVYADDDPYTDKSLAGQNLRDTANIVYQNYAILDDNTKISDDITKDEEFNLYLPHGSDHNQYGSVVIQNDLANEGVIASTSEVIVNDTSDGNYVQSFVRNGFIKNIPAKSIVKNGKVYVARKAIAKMPYSESVPLDYDKERNTFSFSPDKNWFDVSGMPDTKEQNIYIYYYRDLSQETFNIKVKYVDSDENDKLVTEQDLTGKLGDQVATPEPPENYIIDPSSPNVLLFDQEHVLDPDNNPYIVHLVHKTQDVSTTDPKATQTNTYRMYNETHRHYQNGSYGTVGFDESMLPYWTLTMHRSAIKDLVTGKTTYSDWNSDNFKLVRTDPSGDTHEIMQDSNGDFVDSPNVRIYPGSMWTMYDERRNDSSISDITKYIKYITIAFNDTSLKLGTPYQSITLKIKKGTYQDFPEFNIVLLFDQQELSQTFQFYDDITMQNVGDPVNITGFASDQVPTNLKIPTNYKLADNAYLPTDWIFDEYDTNHTYTIHLVHQKKTETDYNPAKRTITIHNPDGTISTYIQTIGYKRDKITDLVTNNVTYGTYALDDPTSSYTINGIAQTAKSYRQDGSTIYFSSIKIPVIPGYKAVVKSNNGIMAVSYRLLALPKQDIDPIKIAPTSNNNATILPVHSTVTITQQWTEQYNSIIYDIKKDNLNVIVPKLDNYEFHLTHSRQNTLAFTYANGTNTYTFSLNYDSNGHLILHVENKDLNQSFIIKSQDSLLKLIKSIIK